jgi:hypothetical protein
MNAPAATVPLYQRLKIRDALKDWLREYPFQRRVTLAVNEPLSGRTPQAIGLQMRELAKKFDARLSHALIGKDWAQLFDHRPFTFFALEKAEAHPHWHVLIWINAHGHELGTQLLTIDKHVSTIWKKLAPAGSCDVQPVDNLDKAIDYATKSLPDMLNLECFVVPDEFRRDL